MGEDEGAPAQQGGLRAAHAYVGPEGVPRPPGVVNVAAERERGVGAREAPRRQRRQRGGARSGSPPRAPPLVLRGPAADRQLRVADRVADGEPILPLLLLETEAHGEALPEERVAHATGLNSTGVKRSAAAAGPGHRYSGDTELGAKNRAQPRQILWGGSGGGSGGSGGGGAAAAAAARITPGLVRRYTSGPRPSPTPVIR